MHTCADIHAHTHKHTDVCVCTSLPVCKLLYLVVSEYVYIQYLGKCMYTYVYVYIYICVTMSVYTYIYIYVNCETATTHINSEVGSKCIECSSSGSYSLSWSDLGFIEGFGGPGRVSDVGGSAGSGLGF